MGRWVVFDQATAAALESKTAGSVEVRSDFDALSDSVVGLAAAAPGTAIAVVPAADSEHALLLRFTRNPRPAHATAAPPSGTRVAPGGFLGLADEVVLEDEPAPPKKWWQKILD